MTPNFGLPQRSIDELHAVFARHNKVHKVVIYGSRAMGNYKRGSDIDLTMYGNNLTFGDLSTIAGELDDSSIPYLVDLSIFEDLDHVKLREHINREGKVFYDRCADWKTVKLGDVCDFQSGLWKGKKEPFTSACVLRNTNFTASGELNYDNVAQLEVETNQLKKRILVKGDIILEKSGGGDKTPVGRVCLFNLDSNEPYSLSNFTARIRVLNTDEIAPKFLHRFLYFLYISGKTEPMQRHSTGIRNLQITQYKDIDFTYPPLAEQQRIVAKLDAAFAEIDTAIEAVKHKEKNADRVFDNSLSNIFQSNNPAWEKETLKNITSKIGSGATPRGGQASYKEEGISLIRSMNVHDMFFKYKNLAKIDDEQASKLSNVTVQDNDVLLNITGASVARCCVIESDVLPARVNQHVSIIRVKENTVMPKLMAYGLVSKPCKDELLAVGDSGGATRQAITKKQIEDFIFCYPRSQEVQTNLIEKLDSISLQTQKLAGIYKKQISQYIALKSAILAQELQSEAA